MSIVYYVHAILNKHQGRNDASFTYALWPWPWRNHRLEGLVASDKAERLQLDTKSQTETGDSLIEGQERHTNRQCQGSEITLNEEDFRLEDPREPFCDSLFQTC